MCFEVRIVPVEAGEYGVTAWYTGSEGSNNKTVLPVVAFQKKQCEEELTPMVLLRGRVVPITSVKLLQWAVVPLTGEEK